MIINEDYLDSISASDLEDELDVHNEFPENTRDVFTEENEFRMTNGLTHLFVFPCNANFGNFSQNNPEPVKPAAYRRLMHTLEMLEDSGLITTFTEPYVFVGEFVTAKMKWWQCYPYNLKTADKWRTTDIDKRYTINYFENIKYCIGIGFPEYIDPRAVVPFLIAFYRFVYSGLNFNLIRTLQIGTNGKKTFEFTDYVEMMTAVLNKENDKAFACFFNILSKLNGDVPTSDLYYRLARVLNVKRPALPMMKRIAKRFFDEDEINLSSNVVDQEVGRQLMAEDFSKDDIIRLNYEAHKGTCPYFKFSAMYSGATYGSYPPIEQGSTLLNTYLKDLKSTRVQDGIFVWTPYDRLWILHLGIIDNTKSFLSFGTVSDLFLIFNCNNIPGQSRACIDAMAKIFHNIDKKKFFEFMTD